MDVRDLIVEVRDVNLDRVGQIVVQNLPGLKIVQRFNNVGTWEITLPADDPIADELRAAGAGLIVTGETGVIISGFTVSAVKSTTPSDPVGIWTIQGVDDSVILGERLAYPTPASADVTAQTTETDARTGLASTVMMEYVDANIGASAPVARQVPYLTVAADPGIGSTVHKSARFRVLGELLAEVGSIDPVGFQIAQAGDVLEFSCYAPVDRTGTIRLDVVNDTLSKSTYGYGTPSVTRAIVGGTGQGTARTFVEVSDTESLAAETLWNRRIETFVDKSNEADSAVLTQAGLEKIVDGGRTGTSVGVMPSSDLTMTYGRDWYLGDRVTVVIGNQEVSAVVTEIALTVASDGIRIGATVGDPAGVDFDALISKREQSTPKRLNAAELKESGSGGGSTTGGLPTGGTAGQILTKVDSVNYNATWQDNYADWTEVVKHRVKAGESLTKGQAVYVSSADGTNMIVSKASNASEATSSKTMGLISSTLANNGFGFVIAEGLLAGLDTSSASAGDPVWLGTSGNLIYGLASKPVAPAHLVFIGIVTRSNSSNGEIFVRPQNGFEINELHDVLIGTKSDNNLIAYDAASGLWKNQTAAEAGLIADGSVAGGDLTGTYPSPSLVATGTAGTYTKVTTDAKGRVSSGTTLSATDIPSLDASKITSGTLPVANGGTGGSTAVTARANLSAVGVFSQDTEPAGGNIGDIWIDTDSAQNVVGATPYFIGTGGVQTATANGAFTTLTVSTTSNIGGFTNASGVITVPLTGLYMVTSSVQWDLNATGNRILSILVNNVEQNSQLAATGTTNTYPRLNCSQVVYLTAGGNIRAQGYQLAGGTLNIQSSRLQIAFLGS